MKAQLQNSDDNSRRMIDTGSEDPAPFRYRKQRRAHWNRVAREKEKGAGPGAFYHHLIRRYHRFLVPTGLRVLELGCGHGALLDAVKPAFGVGIDFSEQMLRCASQRYPGLIFIQADAHQVPVQQKFDVIILSDLVNDLWDLQRVLDELHPLCHRGTRLILNFYNNLWRIPLAVVKRLGWGADVLPQNWFAPHDVFNLLELSGFEVVKRAALILLPLAIPLISGLANRLLVNLPPFSWFALVNFTIARPAPARQESKVGQAPAVSVIIPARNEAGNIESIFKRVPSMGRQTELIFVEGHSADNTFAVIQAAMGRFPERKSRLLRQTGRGKGDAVRWGFKEAAGDILMILDADMTVPPEELPRFYEALVSGKGEFVNGVRLVYPLENQAMRFFNMAGNKFFSLAFSWLLGQPINDTLCGTKVLWKKDYESIAANRRYFGKFDPFGDFDLLFGAAKLNFKIVEIPIRYRARSYGRTNIDRWRHGWLLIKMVFFAARRIKFI